MLYQPTNGNLPVRQVNYRERQRQLLEVLRNRITIDDHLAILRKLEEMALNGDVRAAKLFFEVVEKLS